MKLCVYFMEKCLYKSWSVFNGRKLTNIYTLLQITLNYQYTKCDSREKMYNVNTWRRLNYLDVSTFQTLITETHMLVVKAFSSIVECDKQTRCLWWIHSYVVCAI
jgi:hypothetical protein